jgi:hypothetical protein
MSALTAEERQIHRQLVTQLMSSVRSIEPLAEGFSFRLSVHDLAAAAEVILLERACCPFFRLTLRIDGSADSLDLDITGPEGVAPFIAAEFRAALPAAIVHLVDE